MYLMWKQFHLCFYKIKCSSSDISPTHSNRQEQAADQITSLTVSADSTITINKNKLFSIQQQECGDDLFFSSMASGEEYFDSRDAHLPDLASVYSSQRFFFSSPGHSNSIIDSPDTRPSTTGTFVAARAAGGVRVPKYSLNPYEDFRRSMQEMVEARDRLMVDDNIFDWDYLHELLLCYLALNPEHTHKYIIQAFTDIVISVLSSASSSGTSSPAFHCCQNPGSIEHLHGVSRRGSDVVELENGKCTSTTSTAASDAMKTKQIYVFDDHKTNEGVRASFVERVLYVSVLMYVPLIQF